MKQMRLWTLSGKTVCGCGWVRHGLLPLCVFVKWLSCTAAGVGCTYARCLSSLSDRYTLACLPLCGFAS